MDFNKKLITLLAIFCVVLSAGAVCAADVGNDGSLADQYQDDNGYAGSQYDDNNYADGQDDISDNGDTDSQTIDPDYAHMEHAAGEPTNETGNLTNTTNTTNMTNTTNDTAPVAENTTTNATASHTMPVTGNPIVLLLGVSALAGGYAALRKKD